MQLSKYIHRNPLALPMWKDKLKEYSFSSYPGYINQARNYELCDTKTISEYFSTENHLLSYESFVEESTEISLPESLFLEEDYEVGTSLGDEPTSDVVSK